MNLHSILSNPVVRGALSGFVAAAIVDLHAFRTWQNFNSAATYDWRTAFLRWAQGAVGGALSSAGLGML